MLGYHAGVHNKWNTFLRYYAKAHTLKDALIQEESGQDLVEYARSFTYRIGGQACQHSRPGSVPHSRRLAENWRHIRVNLCRYRTSSGLHPSATLFGRFANWQGSHGGSSSRKFYVNCQQTKV
jgi:hypothetical protein